MISILFSPVFTSPGVLEEEIDYAATFSLQHEFDMLKNKINITPTFNVNAGTQNFLESYYKNQKV